MTLDLSAIISLILEILGFDALLGDSASNIVISLITLIVEMLENGGTISDSSSILAIIEELGILDLLGSVLSDTAFSIVMTLIMLLIEFIASAGIFVLFFVIGFVTSVIKAIVSFIIWLVLFIFAAIGLTNIAKKLGVRHRILAWIPILQIYYIGRCAQEACVHAGKKKVAWGWILLGIYLVNTFGLSFLGGIIDLFALFVPALSVVSSLLPTIVGLAYTGVLAFCHWRIFRSFMGNGGSIVSAVILVLLNDLASFFYFIIGFFKLKPIADKKATEAPSEAPVAEAEVIAPAPETAV